MSKRKAQSHHDCCCRPADRRKHLYVVLDDKDKAYSVHKLDLDVAAADPPPPEPERLPEPPFLRLEVPRRGDSCQFAAMDGKIITLQSNRPVTLVHDADTGALAIGSAPPPALSTHGYLTVPAAGRLYALPGVSARTAGEMYYLEEEPPLPPDLAAADPSCPEEFESERDAEEEMRRRRRSWREKQDRWVWSTAAASPMPFHPADVTCHAVHPDGRTVFVSVKRTPYTWMQHGTFSFDAGRGGGGGAWARHGDWLLPFAGQAFFDAGLDAWVGLDEHGHLCSSNGLSRHGARRAPPARKRGRETLLREAAAHPERRLGAALAYMGDGRFCLVERAVRQGVKGNAMRSLGDGDKCVLHVSTFCARYGKNGELTATSRRAGRSYVLSRHREHFRMRVFYM